MSGDTSEKSEGEVSGSSEGSPSPIFDVAAGRAAGVYDLIRAELISRKLLPGQRLSEAGLSRQYGVSRSPVREALASLERDGLVEHKGMVVVVRERSFEEMLDVFEVRIYVEGAIARDAAKRRTSHDLRRLESVVSSGRRIEPSDRAAMTVNTRQFHDAMALASHNATLSGLQSRLTAQVYTLVGSTLTVPGRWAVAQGQHESIAEAVEAGDADTARALAEEHMVQARDIRIRLYEERTFAESPV